MRFKDAILLNKSNIVLDFHKKQHIIVLTPEKTKHTGRSLYILLPPQLEFLLTKKTDIKGVIAPGIPFCNGNFGLQIFRVER